MCYECFKYTDRTSFGVFKLKMRLHTAQAHLSLYLSKCHILGNHMSRLISSCNHEQSLKQKLMMVYCHQVVVDFHLDFAAGRERSCIMFLKLKYSTHSLTMGCRIHSHLFAVPTLTVPSDPLQMSV